MEGFKSIYSKESKILILGSFPSVKSRACNFYYGNKLNRFWKIMESAFNCKLSTVEEKTECILKHNLALWDICEACDISGSLDSNIKNVKFVDLTKILKPNTHVEKILCNGRKSFDLTTKYLKQHNIQIPVKYLPSTSPANTSFSSSLWEQELLEQ